MNQAPVLIDRADLVQPGDGGSAVQCPAFHHLFLLFGDVNVNGYARGEIPSVLQSPGQNLRGHRAQGVGRKAEGSVRIVCAVQCAGLNQFKIVVRQGEKALLHALHGLAAKTAPAIQYRQ